MFRIYERCLSKSSSYFCLISKNGSGAASSLLLFNSPRITRSNAYAASQIRNLTSADIVTRKSNRLSRVFRDPVTLSENAKKTFKLMLESNSNCKAIQIGYRQSEDTLGMTYTFDMLDGEGVELAESRRPPDEFTTIYEDKESNIKYRCYVHPHALMKVMGATIEVDLDTVEFKLLDKEGFLLEP
jgi:hypothetical protein